MHELDSTVGTEPTLPLAALRAFDTAARLGSFRAAAEANGLTPSAISHQIKTLERSLGAALFRRVGRAAVLTDVGVTFAAQVRHGFMTIERGAAAIRGGPRARQIQVSALALFVQSVMIPNLATFSAQWPDYDVRIETTTRYVDFDSEDVDVAIRLGDGRWPGLRCRELLRIQGAPVASAATLGQRPIVSAADLAGARLIHDTAQPQAWRAWMAAQGVERSEASGDVWLDSAPATLHAAEQGLGVALAIDPLVRSWPGFGTGLIYVLPNATGPCTRYWLVRRPEADRDPRIRAFEAWIREACGGLGTLA